MGKVYFLPVNRFSEMDEFLADAGVPGFLRTGDTVCLKIHFGASSHRNTVPPELLAPLASLLKEKKTQPCLVDTNVLYRGERATTPGHLAVAWKNGYASLGIPVLIAGGLNAEDEIAVPVKGTHFAQVYLAREFPAWKTMIAVTHFKGHVASGIGGTLKNLGMGCASRKGKFAQHASVTPQVNKDRCVGCGVCAENCPADAIAVRRKKAHIDAKKCIGCGQCVHACPKGAIDIPWSSTSSQTFQERLAEYAAGVLSLYPGRFLGMNFLLNISPDCDCIGHPREPLVDDIGLLVSTDPVALDQASADLVKKAPGRNAKAGEDKFLKLRPDCDYRQQLAHAEKLGLGSRGYELIEYDA